MKLPKLLFVQDGCLAREILVEEGVVAHVGSGNRVIMIEFLGEGGRRHGWFAPEPPEKIQKLEEEIKKTREQDSWMTLEEAFTEITGRTVEEFQQEVKRHRREREAYRWQDDKRFTPEEREWIEKAERKARET